ncbi:MAG: hypothetical protein ACXVCP_06760 [Bdellovibrio sp.]
MFNLKKWQLVLVFIAEIGFLSVASSAYAVPETPDLSGTYSGWNTQVLKMGTYEDEFKKVCSKFTIQNYPNTKTFDVITLNYTETEIHRPEGIEKLPFRIWNFSPLSIKKNSISTSTKEYIFENKNIGYDSFGIPSTKSKSMVTFTVTNDRLVRLEYKSSVGGILNPFKNRTHFICTRP